MREQRGDAQTGGEAGDRAEPVTLRLCGIGRRGGGGRLVGRRGSGLRRSGGLGGHRFALHADRFAAAETLGGFGIAHAEPERYNERKNGDKHIFHQ